MTFWNSICPEKRQI